MARCVPYTPLRRARDPVGDAMAEQAAAPPADKLQKEREMMQKKEKKERKEKKRQKKAAKLGEKYELSYDHSKHGHKKRKHENQSIVALETRKDLKDTVEQLEKSGLSEEHEAPSCSPALDGTPESSLDSNKRWRATMSPSPSKQRNGVFRVKLASTNQREGPESTPVLSAKPRALQQLAVKQMGLDLSMAKSQSDFQPHSNTSSVEKQLVASGLKMSVRNGNQLTESRQVSHQQPAIATERVNVVPRASPHPTKVMQRVDPPPTKVLRRVEPAPLKVMQRAGQPMPLEVFQRDTPQVPANMLRKLTAVAASPGQPLNVKLPAMLHKTKTSVEPPVVKQLQQMEALPKDDLYSVRMSIASTPQQMARNGNQVGESRQINQQQPAMVMQSLNVLPRDSPQPTSKVLQRVNPPSRKVLQRADLACVNVMQRPDHLRPSKMFERGTSQVPTDVSKNATTGTPLERPSVEQPALLHRSKVSMEAPVVKAQQQIDSLPKDIPSTVRASIAAAPAKEVKQSSSDRKNRKAEKKGRENRKAEKKEREFADLFVTWKPSPMQAEDMDIDDQDWLFGCGAMPQSNCSTFNGSTRCQSTEQLFSMQPRAVHLPDLHMYLLPYVVPF